VYVEDDVMAQLTAYRYIVTDDRILSGEPIIGGTRTPVRAIVELWRQGVTPESTFCVNMDETPTPLEISVEGGDT
jgi:hypothetical protein